MHGEYGNGVHAPDGRPKVASFARCVIERVSKKPGQARVARLEAFNTWLFGAVSAVQELDYAEVVTKLEQQRLTVDDLIQNSIPTAAEELGDRWTASQMSFAQVSIASARLFGLCRGLGAEWSRVSPFETGASFLLCTLREEDHIIGAAVVSYKLRQVGHSVRSMTRATPQQVVETLDTGGHDCLMLSCSTLGSLEAICKLVRHVRTMACVQPYIVLGGALVHKVDGLRDKTGVDLVTNDVNTVLSLRGQEAQAPAQKVAE